MNKEHIFNKEEFAFLLDKAKGDRSINQYAIDCGISAAHISRFLRQLIDTPPSPETIAKLASTTQNNITYKDLMVAAGHIVEQLSFDILTTAQEEVAVTQEERIESFSAMDMRDRRMLFEKKCFQVILSDLYSAPFKWSVDNSERRPFAGNMVLDIEGDTYKKWYLKFRGTLDSASSPGMPPFAIYGSILMIPLKETDKFTIVTNNEIEFDRMLRRPPECLRANLYVMLIDLFEGIVIREQKISDYHTGPIYIYKE